MNSQSKKMELLGNTSIPKALLAMGIPTMIGMLLSVKLDAPVLCRLDAPELDFACCASADCLHQHLQVI